MGRAGGDGEETACEKQSRPKDGMTEHKKKKYHHHRKHKHERRAEDRRPEFSRMSRQSPWPDKGDMQGRRSTNTKVNENNITEVSVGQAILRNKAPASDSAQKVSVSSQDKEDEEAKVEKDSVTESTLAKIHENHLTEPSSTTPDHTAFTFGSGEESATYRGGAPRVAHDNHFPGAFAVHGFDDSVVEYTPTVDLESPPVPMESEPISAEAVDEEADNRVFNERLQKELKRKLAEKEKNTAVAEVVNMRLCVCSPRVRRMGIVGAVLAVVAVALAIVLSVTLRPEPAQPGLVDFLSSESFDGGVALRTPSTPQNEAMKWLANSSMLANTTDDKKLQRYALATLYYSTNGEAWENGTGWLSDDDECVGWYQKGLTEGTVCTSDGSLMRLNVPSNNLVGTLPEEIALLSDSLGKHLGKTSQLKEAYLTAVPFISLILQKRS